MLIGCVLNLPRTALNTANGDDREEVDHEKEEDCASRFVCHYAVVER